MTYPKLAGFEQIGTMAAPVQLWAGEAPITDDSAPSLAAIQQYQLCALTATGITPFVDGTHTGQQAVIAQIAAAGAGQQVPYWNAGKFNHSTVIWPAAYDTLPKRKALLIGTMLHAAHLILN